MAAGGQYERHLSAKHLRGPITRLPGAEVVGDAGDYICVSVDLRQVDRRSEHRRSIRLDQGIVKRELDEVVMQSSREPRRVSIPVQDVECGRRLALQIVVDPVVPDQIIWPEPGKDLGERSPVKVPTCLRRGHRRSCRGLVDHRAGRPGTCLVKDGYAEAEACYLI